MFHSNAAQKYATETVDRLFDSPTPGAAKEHSSHLYALLISAFEAGRAYESLREEDSEETA